MSLINRPHYASTPMGPWTGGVSGYQNFHVFTFEFPRLQTGELTHREMESLMVEALFVTLLAYIFDPKKRVWYQRVQRPGRDKAIGHDVLKPHQVPARIKAHCLLLEIT